MQSVNSGTQPSKNITKGKELIHKLNTVGFYSANEQEKTRCL